MRVRATHESIYASKDPYLVPLVSQELALYLLYSGSYTHTQKVLSIQSEPTPNWQALQLQAMLTQIRTGSATAVSRTNFKSSPLARTPHTVHEAPRRQTHDRTRVRTAL